MKIPLVLASMTVLAVGFVGCGGSDDDSNEKLCNELCQEQADCQDAPVTSDQCTSVCSTNAASTKAAGCDSQYQALLSCTEGLADKCQTIDQCGPGVGTDWSNCVQRYCQTHQGSSVCPSS